ncbi:hypothetical protein COO60DRAFT_963050 [Scenedesmus sp. NREL 46B-D3]|nr:hypothetical protein COO60DRAFT_963050 [Scenedesmus sp. NREL 46B-D3]
MPADSSAWDEVHSSVGACQDLLAACLDAWGPQSDKVSQTTKKRLISRALAGLGGGQELLQALGAKLRQLQDASSQWEDSVLQVSKSHNELQQQLGSSSNELRACQDRQRQAEADRLAGQRDAEQLRQQLAAATADRQQSEATIGQLEGELHSAAFGANEASCHLNELRAQVDELAAATRSAEETAAAATGALEAAQQEAVKERAARQRHEDAVARLTADNLVFMAKLRAAESAAAAAGTERDELVLALEEHKGPWMDEVHQGVETRVKHALIRAQQLEQQQEEAAVRHEAHLQQLRQQQADLEAALGQAAQAQAALQQQLAAAEAAAAEARAAAEEAAVLSAEAQAAADARAAELRVAQDSLRCMRQECNECWMSERAVRAQLAEAQEQLAGLAAARDGLAGDVQACNDELATQRAVNQQLMLKKEEVEWQLMAAIAKLNYDQQSSSPLSSMHSPLSPHMAAAAAAAAPAGPPQHQLSLDAAPVSTACTTCDAATQLLAGPPQQGGGSPGRQQQLPCGPRGAGSAPFGAVLQEPSPEGSPRGATPGSQMSCGCGLPQVPEEVEYTRGQQQQQQQQQGIRADHRASPSSPPVRPSAFHGAAAASAAAAAGDASSSSSSAVRAMAAAGGLGGLCATTSLPAAFTAGSVRSAGSIPDMFSLPSLSYGLATLPPPELLAAAANRSLAGAGSSAVPEPWECALGLAHGAPLGIGQAALGLTNISHQGSGGSTGSGPGGSFSPATAGAAGGCRGVVVGATGGLMAPFSPLPRARSSSSPGCFVVGSGSFGAIFPESLTASVVTDEEQQLPMRLSLPPNLLQQLQRGQQQQQQAEGLQQVLAQQQASSLQVELQSCQAAAAPAAVPALAGGSSVDVTQVFGAGGLTGGVQTSRKALVHPAFARPAGAAAAGGSSSPVGSPAAAGANASSSSTASSTPDVAPRQCQAAPDEQPQQQRVGSASSMPCRAGGGASEQGSSSTTLHGILVHSRPRSPAPGVSRSSSMKSVRFSFENLDQDGLHHVLGASEAGSKKLSPWGGRDRQELQDQCRVQQGGLSTGGGTGGHHLQQQQQHMADGAASWIGAAGSYNGRGSCSRGGAVHALMPGNSGSGLSAGGFARSPPTGSEDEDCYQIQAGHASRSEGGAAGRCSRTRQLMLQQQQLKQAKAAAAARAAAMVVNLPLPKGSPVHPCFGRAAPMAAAQQASSGGCG